LTCWTGPAMREAFLRVYGSAGEANDERRKLRKGKLGASFAVILGHVVPFMGAQTTIMQRYFLPHPLDTIVSQPFGMTEDLISMAMSEATSNPVLASGSLTAMIVMFNFFRGFVFTGCPHKEEPDDTSPSNHLQLERSETFATKDKRGVEAEARDWVAVLTMLLNFFVGVAIGYYVANDTGCGASGGNSTTTNTPDSNNPDGHMSFKFAFWVVAGQMLVQLIIVPICLDGISEQIHNCCSKITKKKDNNDGPPMVPTLSRGYTDPTGHRNSRHHGQ